MQAVGMTVDASLEIKVVHPTRGCTRATNSAHLVEPGKTGIISSELQTASFNGPLNKTITVSFNAGNEPSVTLELKAMIWRPIEVTPGAAAFTGVLDARRMP